MALHLRAKRCSKGLIFASLLLTTACRKEQNRAELHRTGAISSTLKDIISLKYKLARKNSMQRRLSVGPGATCFLSTQGKMSCWGLSLGPKYESLPTLLPHSEPFVQISRYNIHACALTSSGEVWCAGWNDFGELGTMAPETCQYFTHGTPNDVPCSGSLLRVPNLPPIDEVVAGSSRTCAVARNGDVYCWGYSGWGVLGMLPEDPSGIAKTPVKFPHLENVHSLALGAFFSCALKYDGTVWCWGSNTDGERGQGTRDERRRWDKQDKEAIEPPVQVPQLGDITEITAGDRHVCALNRKDKKLFCWGSNGVGQLGFVEPSVSELPREVALPKEFGEFAAIAAGGATTCALNTAGDVYCWGIEVEMDRDVSPTPQRIKGIPPIAAMAVESRRYCALDKHEKVWCWGYASAANQMGYPSKPGTCEGGCWSKPGEVEGL